MINSKQFFVRFNKSRSIQSRKDLLAEFLEPELINHSKTFLELEKFEELKLNQFFNIISTPKYGVLKLGGRSEIEIGRIILITALKYKTMVSGQYGFCCYNILKLLYGIDHGLFMEGVVLFQEKGLKISDESIRKMIDENSKLKKAA